jgi:hypothetical protein
MQFEELCMRGLVNGLDMACIGSLKGTSPYKIVYNSMPRDQTSAGSARYGFPIRISGEANEIVP